MVRGSQCSSSVCGISSPCVCFIDDLAGGQPYPQPTKDAIRVARSSRPPDHLVIDSHECDRYDAATVTTVHNSHPAVPTDILRALDEVAQALSVIAPVTARVRKKLGPADEDAAALQS